MIVLVSKSFSTTYVQQLSETGFINIMNDIKAFYENDDVVDGTNVNNFFLCHSPGWKFINFVKQTVFFRAITVLHDIRPVKLV